MSGFVSGWDLKNLYLGMRGRNVRWGLWDRVGQGEGGEESCKDEESIELHDEFQRCDCQSRIFEMYI